MISLRYIFISLHHIMYRPAESVNWCQCCMRGVPLPDMQRAADLLGDHHTPQVVDATHDSSCFHIEIPSVYDPSSFGSSICKRGNFMRVFSALEFALANRRFIFFAECVLKSSAAQPMLLLLHKMVQIGVPAV